jgi:hypothetical protein
MSHWRHSMLVGAEFWITSKRLKVIRKAGCLQLIQNSAPSTIMRRQCDIWIHVKRTQWSYFATFFGDWSQSEKFSKIKLPLVRGQKEEGQTLSQDVDCLMGSYMPPCPPWTDWYTIVFTFFYMFSLRKHLRAICLTSKRVQIMYFNLFFVPLRLWTSPTS